ncbi:DUF4357 domain-containing protein [Butyrivibrio sp. AE2015]|uniref:DUF4357 domain-containing protein n=1 Tax=Butyrivibrio sp. AE2015 TaxID=1280663 RepID=UPI0004135E1B|nr:DUF4357 domain-containing protein [Butyrivibrio sp. AE2015]
MDYSTHARGKLIKEYRDNNEIVSKEGVVLKDCIFPSISYAARFVTGKSQNGYDTWKVNDTTTLGEYLIDAGIRKIKRRNR